MIVPGIKLIVQCPCKDDTDKVTGEHSTGNVNGGQSFVGGRTSLRGGIRVVVIDKEYGSSGLSDTRIATGNRLNPSMGHVN